MDKIIWTTAKNGVVPDTTSNVQPNSKDHLQGVSENFNIFVERFKDLGLMSHVTIITRLAT